MTNIYNRIRLQAGGKAIKLGFLLVFSLIMFSGNIFAQNTRVSGTVKDTDGEVVPGATVVVKGTTNGTVTDLDGKFSLEAGPDATLVISFIGYVDQEIVVGTRSVINVALETDIQQLGEVVVVGYGSVEKKDLTGVVSRVDEREFNKGIIGSPDKLISGKVAGLQVESSGEPGSNTNIRLRGMSINGQNPLFVVDGVPITDTGVAGGRNPLNFMNPADVEDVTVLKDASAAAIYGSRGANGVILITTKNGQAGKIQVSYDGFYSISKNITKPDIFSANVYRQVIYDKQPQELDNLGDANTNWVDEVLQVAQGTSQNVSVSGGTKKTSYFGSVNYLNNNGVMRYTGNEQMTFSVKLSQKLFNDNLTLRASTKTGWTKNDFSPNVIGAAMAMDPTQSVFDPDNTEFGGYFQWQSSLATANPVATQDLNDQHGNTFRSLNSLQAEYKIPFVKGLTFNANLAYDRYDGEYNGTTSAFEKNNVLNQDGVSMNQSTQVLNTQTYEYYFDYKKHIEGIDSKLGVMVGYSWQNFDDEKTDTGGTNVIDGKPTADTTSLTFTNGSRLISYYGRVNFDVKDKYLFTVNLRTDGSSKFGPENKWGFFPGFSAGWRILDEKFATGLTKVFSDLKLRVGYGTTGNQSIPSYQYEFFYRLGTPTAAYQFGNEYVQMLRALNGANLAIQWEETVSTNFGLDFGLYKGRLQGSIDYYIKDVNKLLYKVAWPAGSNLADRVFTNIAEVRNQGIELTLNAVAFDRPDFEWDVAFNVAGNTNEVGKIDNSNDEKFGGYTITGISGDVGQTIQVIKVGEPVSSFLTYNQLYNENGAPIFSAKPIDMYEDVNEDGIINENDLIVNKAPNPPVIMGLTSNMRYKAFELSFTLRSNIGNYVYNNVASSTGYFQLLTANGVTNNINTSAYETNFNTRQLKSNYYIENASFMKLDNITLAYNIEQVKFAKIKAYVTAQNLFTVTGYTGMDPEVFNGVDNNLYPRSATLILGVSARF